MRWFCDVFGWHTWVFAHRAVWRLEFAVLTQEFRTCRRCGCPHPFDQTLVSDAGQITRQLPEIEEI